MNKRIATCLAAGLLVGLAPALASATVIGLPTGTGQGTVGTADPNFELIGAPLLSPAEMALGAVIIDPSLIPSNWLTPGSGYGWTGVIDDDARVTPGTPNDPSSWGPDGVPASGDEFDDAYIFRVEFEIVGDPSTTVIQGAWATDNWGQIWVNDQYTGILTLQFLELQSFVLTEHFQEGLNFIDFKLVNIPLADPEKEHGNPTGLLVQDLTEKVPEPGTVLLIGVGLGALALRRRRWIH